MTPKSVNPFTFPSNLPVPVVRVYPKPHQDETTGDWKCEPYYYEASDYLRLYQSPKHRQDILSLSSKARDLYLIILYTMNDDYEHVVLSYKKVNELYKTSGAKKDMNVRVFKETVKELVEKAILDLKDRKAEHYWINPNYFFRGDRSKQWPDNRIVKRTIDNRSPFQQITMAS